jgi:hypothetical protein
MRRSVLLWSVKREVKKSSGSAMPMAKSSISVAVSSSIAR